jgi:hypothetical protein
LDPRAWNKIHSGFQIWFQLLISTPKAWHSKSSSGITSNSQTWIQFLVTIPTLWNCNHSITQNHLLEFILTVKPCSNSPFPF